ncbi:MAG: N-acetylmuramoyl-L-alanine amidase family protein [bacterium]
MYNIKLIISILCISLFLAFPSKAQLLDNITVIIDAGHGGKDVGCVGPAGGIEKNITLDLTIRLQKFITQRTPINVLFTRETDETISLDARGSFANSNHADLFISVHTNAGFDKNLEGLCVYYYEAPEMDLAKVTMDRAAKLWSKRQLPYIKESERLAQSIADEARVSNIWRRVSVSALPLSVLEYVAMPAVLIETEFISSAEGERKLLNASYRQKIAECVYRGIIRYLK